MKKHIFLIMSIALFTLAIFALTFNFFILDAQGSLEEQINIRSDATVNETIKVKELKLVPTESKEYEILFAYDITGNFKVSLDYFEKHDGGLKEYVLVNVSRDGEELYAGTLKELLDENVLIEFEEEIDNEHPVSIKIVYTMPREVGNEAQGSFATFNIKVKIEKE